MVALAALQVGFICWGGSQALLVCGQLHCDHEQVAALPGVALWCSRPGHSTQSLSDYAKCGTALCMSFAMPVEGMMDSAGP